MIKLVKDTIVTAISDIVIGLITESVSDGKMTIKENIKFWSFKKKIKKWLREFIKKNDGTILTSGKFEDFLKYYKPIEKIYEHLLQSNGDITTKEELINGLVGQLKVFFNDDEGGISVLDESVVRELLVKIYTEYEEYLTSGLSVSEQYLKASILKNQKSESKRQLEYSNNNIREIIEHTSQIKNPEEVMKVYDILSQEIRKGNIEQVHDLLPFLGNKNADIDMAMQIKLSLLSDYQCLDMEALEAWKKIKSNYISDDITRILMLYWFDKKEKMTQLEKLIKNSDLKEIAGIISRDEKEKFMKLEKKNRHHVDNYEFSLTGQYSNEKWLVNRVCALWLAEKPIINIHELIQQLFGNNLSYIEEIYVLEKEQDTIVNTISLENVKEDGRVKEIGKILSGMKQKIAHNNNKIKLLYYRTFLKNQVVLEEKNIELLNEIPDVIKKDSAIETMMIQYKIDLGCIDEEAVVEFCERAGTYWLYCNLLRKKCNNWNQVKESIESHNGILEKDIYLFLLYVQSIRVCDGKEAAITEWKKYQSVYKDYVEYWLEIFKVHETERKMLPELFEKWKDGQLEWLDPEAEVDFAKVLIDCRYYKEAMQIVEKKEALGQVSPDILRLDVFGISDYDALALAQGKKAVIVTGEVTIQSLIQEIKLNISGTGILNFLVALKMDVYVLLDCIEQMIKYRFEITMTEKCLRYIIDEYSKLENQELKEDFMCKWIDCLTLAESKGNVYKEVYAQNMMRVCQDIIREEYEVLNPVWRNYFSLCVKYKCGLETK